VVCAEDERLAGCPDLDQLMRAESLGRVLYTFNARDFLKLHVEMQPNRQRHPGIIIGKQKYSVGEQLRRVLRLKNAKSTLDMRDSVEFISNWG
jgi:hypothetical protein